jgi:hypothetical protein
VGGGGAGGGLAVGSRALVAVAPRHCVLLEE